MVFADCQVKRALKASVEESYWEERDKRDQGEKEEEMELQDLEDKR